MNNKGGLVEFLGICCIFSVFLDKAIRGIAAFDLYYYYPIFALFLFSLVFSRGEIFLPPKWFLKGFGIIFISSVLILYVSNTLGFPFWKQVFGILFTAIVYYNVIAVFEFKAEKVFDWYLKFAFLTALFGVVNNGLHMVGIHITQPLRTGAYLYRESSIMGEPFYLALALTPAIAYYFMYFQLTWKTKKKQLIILLLCYVITYSSIAVAGLALSGFFALYINDYLNLRRNKLILAPLLLLPVALFIVFLINNVNLINARFSDTTELFFASELNVQEAGQANASTFALYSNYIIARDSFLKDPIFGSGLGSHPIIFEETFLKYFPSRFLTNFGGQNQQDANSKFLRLMSETGLIGLILFLYAFYKWFAPKSRINSTYTRELAVINYSIFIYIVLCLVRNGNYINIGFFLFFFLYFISGKSVKLQPKS